MDRIKFANGHKYDLAEGDTDLILADPAYHVNEDESVTISIREKTDIEKRLDALEESQDIQDGAIADLADVIGG